MAKEPKPGDFHTLMFELSRALMVWQHTENIIGEIFCRILGEATEHGPARSAYCSVMNLNIRIDMVHAAIHTAIDDEAILSKWDQAYRRTSKLAKNRNRIVHFNVVHDIRKGVDDFWLTPTAVNTSEFRKSRDGKGTRWGWKDLENFKKQFGELAAQLAEIDDDLRVLLGPR